MEYGKKMYDEGSSERSLVRASRSGKETQQRKLQGEGPAQEEGEQVNNLKKWVEREDSVVVVGRSVRSEATV